MWILIISAAVALLVTFFCSLAEACLLSLSLTDIAHMATERPRAAQVWRRFKENVQRPIAVILIINSLFYTMGATISGSKFHDLFGPKWIVLYSLVFAIVAIQWMEILPKTLGVKFNRKLAVFIAGPLRFLVSILSPVVWLIQAANRPFEGKGRGKPGADALSEILVLSRFAAMNKMMSPEEATIIARSMNLSKTRVADVMVKRDEIRALATSMKMADAFLEAHVHRHTRYVLTENNDLDRVVGYVNFKDIVGALRVNPRNPTLQGIARDITAVKPEDNLMTVLTLMIKNHLHIAIVRNALGSTAGLVTLEDLMEVIVGKIEDEFDILPNYVNKLSTASYLAGGGVRMSALRTTLGPDFPDAPTTLSDWLRKQAGGTPRVDTILREGKWTFGIKRIRRSSVYEVTIDRASES